MFSAMNRDPNLFIDEQSNSIDQNAIDYGKDRLSNVSLMGEEFLSSWEFDYFSECFRIEGHFLEFIQSEFHLEILTL